MAHEPQICLPVLRTYLPYQFFRQVLDVTKVGVPPESIPQKIEPVVKSANVGLKATRCYPDVAHSLRDRGRGERGEDRAAISHTKADSRQSVGKPFFETIVKIPVGEVFSKLALRLRPDFAE
jgi:hypothetical protein